MKASTLLSVCLGILPALAWAQSDNKLTVYTYGSFAGKWGPGPNIKQAFEAECGCELDLQGLDDGVAILNRLRMEGKTSPADLILGLDNNLLEEAKQTGLFATHQVDTQRIKLPNGWHDEVFIPYDYSYFAFVYNKQKLKNPPQSLRELVYERQDIRIIHQDPRTSTVGQGLMLWMKSVFGDQAPQAWQMLSKKTVTVTKGWSEAYALFLKGEADLVLSYVTSPLYHQMAEQDENYASATFSEGHYMQVEMAAKLAHSPRQALADQFMQFMLSDAAQTEVALKNWMLPVVAVDLPDAFSQLALPTKTLSFDAKQVQQNRRQWIREWQTALTF